MVLKLSNWTFLIKILSIIVITKGVATSGSVIEEKLGIGDKLLILNGSGLRTMYGISLYECALYLQKKSCKADEIINADAPMAVRMIINSSLITSDRLERSTREGFQNSIIKKIDTLDNQINRFLSIVVQDLKKGDVFTFIYLPDYGTLIMKNGERKGVIEGILFKKALFGIWLCKKPPQKKLQRSMLGVVTD